MWYVGRAEAAFPSVHMPAVVVVTECNDADAFHVEGWGEEQEIRHFGRSDAAFTSVYGRDEVIGERSRALCTAVLACCSQFPLKPEHTYEPTKEGAM